MKITLKEIIISAGIAFLILISPLFIYHKITHMNKDDLVWMNVYEAGDTVLFCCNNGSADTLLVLEKKIHNSLNPFNFKDYEVSWEYLACANFDMILKHQGQSYDVYFAIEKFKRGVPVDHTFVMDNRFAFNLIEWIRGFKFRQDFYDDCIIIDDRNSKYGNQTEEKDKRIKMLVWSKSEGLVYYNWNDSMYVIIDHLKKQ